MESFKKYLSELVGSALLVFFGCGTAALVGTSGSAVILTALAFGLTYMAAFYSFAGVSGCHLNPAVSISMLLLRRIGLVDCLGYIAAQLIGAIGGSALLYGIFSASSLTDRTGTLAANSAAGSGIWTALVLEAALTFLTVLTYIRVTDESEYRPVSGAVIGLSLTLANIFGAGVTGASVNPARSLGPALFARGAALSDLWVFTVAPVVGGILASLLSVFLDRRSERKKI
jgi:aquaporin Z